MNSEEARFILAAVRPSATTASEAITDDPNVAEALRIMENDPQLKAWYREHGQFDQAVSVRLGEIVPPDNLEATILAGVRMSPQRPWWRRPANLAIATAAALALLATIAYQVADISPSGNGDVQLASDLEDFRGAMIGEIRNLSGFDLASSEPGPVGDWLRQKDAPSFADHDLPTMLGDAQLAGCKLLDWNGHRVSLICFRSPTGEPDADPMANTFHLVIVDSSAFGDVAEIADTLSSENGWSSVAWTQGSKTCLLATQSVNRDDLPGIRERIRLG